MADTFSKKSLQQKRAKKKQDKQERKEERKTNNNKGKRLEEMLAYVDEYGNLTDVPPDAQKRTEIKTEDIILGAAPVVHQTEFTGRVDKFFTEKAYGFITEDKTQASIFVHNDKVLEAIKENDRVVYEKQKTPKGYIALNVRKIN